jgi:spore coat protein CotH
LQEVSDSLNFTSSNLPIVVINTHGQEIPDEPKIMTEMGIIYNGEGVRNYLSDPLNHYYGKIGIELRGNSTQMFPKKQYSLETRDSTGANLDVSLLGMPADNDWILLASYIDRTFIRDPLAHYLSTLTGRWSSLCRFCELILNGEYQGVYILTEKIKRVKNRLNISKLTQTDTSGDNITGGYIYEVDGFGGDFGETRLLVYPKIEEVVNVQLDYIRSYDDSFRNVMNLSAFNDTANGYSKWIDVDAFIDELIVQETVRNSDAYGWSAYFHKDKNKKLAAGPVWDFDQSAGNSNYPDNGIVEGWMFAHTGTMNTPFFWKKLYSDPAFKSELQIRWKELRKSVFSTDKIMAFIDSCANYLNEAQQRNFKKWPVLGAFIWRETTGYQDRNTYQKEIDYMKSFLSTRLDWMDNKLQNTVDSNISLVNPSFEEPGIAKIKGWDGQCTDPSWTGLLYDIPGWSSDAPALDSGVETGYPSDGLWAAFLMGRDTSMYQITDHLIDTRDNIELTIDARNFWQAPLLKIELFYLDNTSKVTLVSREFSISDVMTAYSISFGASVFPASIGHKFGILFDNISPVSSSWIALDNVKLVNHETTAITDRQMHPVIFSLAQNYPNPFNPSTTFSFGIQTSSFVSLKIFDVTGRQVATVVSEELAAGKYKRLWNAEQLSSGVYFYKLQTESYVETKRMVLIK